MKEKIYEIPIDHPLTAAKRKAIDQYIARHAHLAPSGVQHSWDEQSGQILILSTPPVKWEVGFKPKIVEIHASAPFWAYVLFTQEKRSKLKAEIELLLYNTDFFKDGKKNLKKVKTTKKKA